MSNGPNRLSTLAQISRLLKTLSRSEQAAARFVLSAPEQVALLPLRRFAAECGVSEPTVLRFCRRLGFSGYQDFKLSLIPQILRANPAVFGTEPGDHKSRGQTLSAMLGASVRDTVLRAEDASLDRASSVIADAGRIVTAGLGGAAGVAYILADSLTALGKPCFSSHDPSYLQVLPESLRTGDVVVGISHSGETDEVVRLVERATATGAESIAITNYEGAPLDAAAGITLFTTYPEDVLGSYSPAARVAGLALVVALVERVAQCMRETSQ
jgi:DNA-binding MurR/RpiR family transcriptional regulator